MSIGFVVGLTMLIAGTLCIRTVPSGWRLAVFEFGEFRTLKGPGAVFRMPFVHTEWITVKLGDCGELVARNTARIEGRDFPADSDEDLPIGARVRVIEFQGNKVLLARDQLAREVRCPNCSFRFPI